MVSNKNVQAQNKTNLVFFFIPKKSVHLYFKNTNFGIWLPLRCKDLFSNKMIHHAIP